MRYCSHAEFLREYRIGKMTVLVNRSRAGDFVLSEFGRPEYKLAHYFWTWLAILCVLGGLLLWVFYSWKIGVGLLFLGIMLNSSARKSAGQFVLGQMLDNEDFWTYVLLHGGAEIRDAENRRVTSDYLGRTSLETSASEDQRAT